MRASVRAEVAVHLVSMGFGAGLYIPCVCARKREGLFTAYLICVCLNNSGKREGQEQV